MRRADRLDAALGARERGRSYRHPYPRSKPVFVGKFEIVT